jgi:RNA polymerase sigma-70 factor (ECF subfamily)
MNGDEAMAAYANGNARAFEIVYEAVAPRLQGYLRKHLREEARVDDIIQQTFLQMHVARASFIPGAEVLPWAFAIAKRLMIDWQRKTRRERPLEFTDGEDGQGRPLASGAATAEEVAVARQTGQRMVAAMAELSEPQRQALNLRQQGMSCADAASRLNTTPTGFKLRIHRALQTLRAALRDGD